MTTFNDIFKSSFLSNVTSVSITDMVLALALSFCIGLFIFFIYKKTFQGVMYSASFGVTLVALTMISTFVILAITSNVVLSLGMVGALSIVRFRTAIKEPLDIAYLFWSIAAGIVLAAGLIPLAVFGSLFIGLVLLIFANRKTFIRPYIVVIKCGCADAESNINSILKEKSNKTLLKAKTVRENKTELTYEIRLKSDDTSFINDISAVNGVESAVLVTYNGEYM